MGLIENCNRVKQNVENIYTVLEENGIVIPEGTTSDNLDELIDFTIENSGTDTSDATATADEVFAGETAYAADGKITGTFTIENELTAQNDLIEQINTLVATKANPQGGIDTSDATAITEDILKGKTAYIANGKVTGTFTIDEEVLEQKDLISQINTALLNKITYNTLYLATSEPTDDIGVDGDIYIVKEATAE